MSGSRAVNGSSRSFTVPGREGSHIRKNGTGQFGWHRFLIGYDLCGQVSQFHALLTSLLRALWNFVYSSTDWAHHIERCPADQQPLTALNLAILKDLWMPDVEIRNLQSFETHTILSKLEGLWVDASDHSLMHALASRITFICPMRFNSFPLDVQVSEISTLQKDLSLFYDGKHSIWYFSQSVCSLSLHHRHLSKSSKVQNTLLSVLKNIFRNIVCNIYNIFLFTTIPRPSIRGGQVLTMLIPSSK